MSNEHGRNDNPAEVYDSRFVPALFGPWAARVAEAADIRTGHRVLDVACGTGALTRVVAECVGPTGSVVGLDPNEQMLAVAMRHPTPATWMVGRGESIGLPDASFDRVVSQFGFMFFEQPSIGLSEMMRVLRPDGRLLVAVCAAVDHSPAYAVLTELLHRLFGPEVAEAFRAPFALGDPAQLRAVAEQAGVAATVTRHSGVVRFDSIAALVAAERACAWTLGGLLDDAQFERLTAEVEVSLRPFAQAGRLSFDMPALWLQATQQ